MKFIADVMLGSLAKRLRLLGADVLYDPAADDNEVLRRSLSEGRTILTRDNGLAGRPLAGNRILIRSDHLEAQLEQVRSACPALRDLHPLSRCSVCNEPLTPADRDDVRDLIPDHVLRTIRAFLRCGRCGRVYWNGSHVRRMDGIGGMNNKKKPAS